MDKKGLFITFEGGEGSGKSTQVSLLKDELMKEHKDLVLLLREPGGTAVGEEIRSTLIDPQLSEMTATTEALLYAASQAQIMEEKIMPHLENDGIVIVDRFIDSSLVYQGLARKLGVDVVLDINKYSILREPDITFFLDVPPDCGFKRKKKNDMVLDRIEKESVNFHKLVYTGYKDLAKTYNRICTIDGTKDIDTIHQQILKKTIQTLEETI